MKRLVITCILIIIVRGQHGYDVSTTQNYSEKSENQLTEIVNSINSTQLVMLPNETEKLIQEGTQLEIQCNSKHPVKFSFLNSMFWSCDTKNEISSQNGIHKFLIRETSSTDTGWYACATTSTEIPNDWTLLNSTNGDIRWIYIFVNSSKPFVDWLPALPKTIIVTGTHAVVPCRTTSPELDVKLLVNYQNVEKNETISFDPKIGYIIKRPAFEEFETLFTCQFAGVEDNYVLRYSNGGGRKPKMISPAKKTLFLDKDKELKIQCDSDSAIRFAFPLEEGKTSEYNISLGPNGTTIFRRPKVRAEDAGWYGCTQKNIDTTIPYFSVDYTRNEISWIYVYVFDPLTYNNTKRNVYSYVGKNFTILPNRYIPRNLDDGPCKVHTDMSNGSERSQFTRYGDFYQGNNRPKLTTELALEFNSISYTISSADEIDPLQLFSLEIPKRILRVGENLHGGCQKASYNASEAFCIPKWTLPKTVTSNRVTYTFNRRFDPLSDFNVYYKIMNFTIMNLTKDDEGIYYCECNSRRGNNEPIQEQVRVFDPESPTYMQAGAEPEHKFENQEGMTTEWVVDYSNYSNAFAKWYDPQREAINNTDKFEILDENALTMLIISNITRNDSGMYLVEVLNSTNEELLTSITITLEVPGTNSNFLLLITIPSIVFILIVCTVVPCLYVRRSRNKKAEKKWKSLALARLNEESVDVLNRTSPDDDYRSDFYERRVVCGRVVISPKTRPGTDTNPNNRN